MVGRDVGKPRIILGLTYEGLRRSEWVRSSWPVSVTWAGTGLGRGRRHIEGFGQAMPLFSRIPAHPRQQSLVVSSLRAIQRRT